MEDKEFLLQKIEFLEFQLEDAKCKEVRTKSMYESMLNSLSVVPLEKNDNEKLIQMQKNHAEKIFDLETVYKHKLKALEAVLNDSMSEIQYLKNQNLNVHSVLETKIKSLEADIDKKSNFISEISGKLEFIESAQEIKDKEILILKKQIDDQRNLYQDDILDAHKEENNKLEQLKNIYESEKKSLYKTIQKLKSENNLLSTNSSLEVLKKTETIIDETLIKQKQFEKLLSDLISSIKKISSGTEFQLSFISELPLKEKLDITEKMLKYSSITQENFIKIKNSLASLKNLLVTKTKKEESLKELLKKKNEEIDNLHRTIDIKSYSQSRTESDELVEELINKNSEICKLKKIIGEMSELKNKPPVYSPMHLRSKTAPSLDNSPFKILSKPNVSKLDLSRLKKTEANEKIEEANAFTTDRLSGDKVEMYKKKIELLKSAISKLKNQRDRSRNISDKLICELKQKKLDLALIQESFLEQNHSLLSKLKSLINYMSSLSNSTLLPKIFKQDLLKILSHFSDYLPH